jgi:ZIP family zinc transporter
MVVISAMKVLLVVLVSVGCSSMLGVLGGLVVRALPHRLNDVVMGLSAGIMLAAATAGLLANAFAPSADSIALAIAGALAGAVLISLLDRFIPHLHRIAGIDFEEHRSNGSIGKALLFVAALAIHKIPEGLAVGVSFGTGEIGDVLTISLAISLQNIPEAFVIVAPLYAVGVKSPRIIAISLGIAFVSIVAVLVGYALVAVFSGVLPFLLAAAGGAMLYVISDEIIPESHSHGFEKPATFALIFGFLLVLALQSALSVGE